MLGLFLSISLLERSTARTRLMKTTPLLRLTPGPLCCLMTGCFLLTPLEEAPGGEDMAESLKEDAPTDLAHSPLDMPRQDLSDAPDNAGDMASPDLPSYDPVATVSITSSSPDMSCVVNTGLQLGVEARDAKGRLVPCEPLWSVDEERDARISQDGLVEPINTGLITVSATCESITRSVEITSTLPSSTSGDTQLEVWLAADRHITRDRDIVTSWSTADQTHTFSPLDDSTPFLIEKVPNINNFPAVEFNRDYLRSSKLHTFEDTVSIITVVQSSTLDEINFIVGFCNRPSEPELGNHSLQFDPNNDYELNSKATVEGNGILDRTEYNVSTIPTIWHVRTLIVGANTVTFHEDGELISSRDVADPSLRFRFNNLGGWCSSGGNNRFSGRMAELLFFKGELSDIDREAIEAYLTQKYDL